MPPGPLPHFHTYSHTSIHAHTSLNYVDNLKFGIDSVVKANGVAEATLCYTGDVLDPKKTKVSVLLRCIQVWIYNVGRVKTQCNVVGRVKTQRP